jgi:hypothetical protein
MVNQERNLRKEKRADVQAEITMAGYCFQECPRSQQIMQITFPGGG